VDRVDAIEIAAEPVAGGQVVEEGGGERVEVHGESFHSGVDLVVLVECEPPVGFAQSPSTRALRAGGQTAPPAPATASQTDR
jgi:hypothetical protein